MADTEDSKSSAGNGVWVRIPPRAPAPVHGPGPTTAITLILPAGVGVRGPRYPRPVTLAVDSAVLVIGIVCVLAAVVLVAVIVAPWKSVRDEGPMDRDVETRLMLGEDPKAIADDLDRRGE